MESAIGLLFLTLILILWALLIGYAIRNRIKIAVWLNAPDICAPESADRKEQLRRHIKRKEFELLQAQWKIDDAAAELKKLEDKEVK